MKKYQLKSFNSVFFLLWIIIAGIIWAVDDSNYPFLFQKIGKTLKKIVLPGFARNSSKNFFVLWTQRSKLPKKRLLAGLDRRGWGALKKTPALNQKYRIGQTSVAELT